MEDIQPPINQASIVQNQDTIKEHQPSDKSAIVALLLVYLNPVGVFLMWKWMKGWKKSIKILITIPLLLTLIGLFAGISMGMMGYNSIKKLESAKIKITPTLSVPSQTPTVDETANWKIYALQNDGYTLKYPQDWSYQQVSPFGGIIFSSPTVPQQSFQILVATDASTLETIAKDLSNMGNVSDVTLDGVVGKSVNFTMPSPPGNGSTKFQIQEIGLLRDNKRYYLILERPEGFFDNIPNQILQTFKFTDQTASWKTYANNELGFSIKYPQNWGEPIWPCHTKGSVCFSVRGYNTANYKEKPNKVGGTIGISRGEGSIDDFCQSQSFNSPIISCEQSSLNTFKALKKVEILDDGFSNNETKTFYLIHGKYYYLINGTFVRTDALTEKEINQILQTFRFLK